MICLPTIGAVAVESALPQLVREDGDRRRAHSLVVDPVVAADDRWDELHLPATRRGREGRHRRRVAAPGQRARSAEPLRGDRLEGVGVVAPRRVVAEGRRVGVRAVRRLADRDDAAAVGERQRLEHHAVDDAEDRAVGADAERQGRQRGRGESRSLAKLAKPEDDVLFDRLPPLGSLHRSLPLPAERVQGIVRWNRRRRIFARAASCAASRDIPAAINSSIVDCRWKSSSSSTSCVGSARRNRV